MPRSSAQYVADIRRRLRDRSPLASNPIWNRDEILDALQDAQRDAYSKFWVEEVYSSLSLSPGTRGYPLPNYVTERNIISVERQQLPYPGYAATNPINPDGWQLIRDYHVESGQQTNQLWFGGPWWGWNQPNAVRVRYERPIPIFPVEDTLTQAISSTQGSVPFLASNSAIAGWPVPGYVQVGQEIIRYESVTATSFTSLLRGQFGTGIATATNPLGLQHSSQTLLSPVWPVDDIPQYDGYVIAKSIQALLMQRLLTSDSQAEKNVATLAAEWGRTAERERQAFGLRHSARPLRVRRQTR
jgi:hypothetical protein